MPHLPPAIGFALASATAAVLSTPTSGQPAGDKTLSETFESGIPEHWAAKPGTLTVSDRHFKHGRHSLHWRWTRCSPLWVVEEPRLIAAAEAVGTSTHSNPHLLSAEPRFVDPTKKEGGVMLWVHSPERLKGQLLFEFGTPESLERGKPSYRFSVNLGFQGWRDIWVHFEEDARNPDFHAQAEGAAKVTTMRITPPAESPEGGVFFDMVDFADYVPWKRTPDVQVPFTNPHDQNSDPDRDTNTWISPLFWMNRVGDGRFAGVTVTEADRQALRVVEERFEKWILGDRIDLAAYPYSVRNATLQKLIKQAIVDYDRYEIKREDGVITGTPLFAIRSPYEPKFGHDFFEKVLLYLAIDYRLNGNADSLTRCIDALDYVHDQGWAGGSSLGTMDHEGLRLGGYFHAVFLLRDQLRGRGSLQRELDTMRWQCSLDQIYSPDTNFEVTVDYLRSYAVFRLLTVLSMEDSPLRVADMRHLKVWMETDIQIKPGFMGGIKPDYTGYHHRGVYANAYSPEAYHVMSLMTYFLRDTPFAVSPHALDPLRKAMLAQRMVSNLYDVPVAISGRMPGGIQTVNQMLPAYAYLALSGDPVDQEMAAVFMRLWLPESEALKNDLFPEARNSIVFLNTFGSLEAMLRVAAMGAAPEPSPTGHWTLPYAAMSVHRRDDWMASVKGWSQYVWDFEGARTQHRFARYLSHGTLQVYATGNPISGPASGYRFDQGWDWNRFPGATAVHLPLAELEMDSTVSDEYREGRHRNFSDQTTVGGVTLDGQNGLFSMVLHDTAYDRSFYAYKSYFFFDNRIVCLGTGIRSDNAEYPAETTLFQSFLPSPDSETIVNSEAISTIPFAWSGKGSTSAWLRDPYGHGYVVPDATQLRFTRETQTSRDETNTTDTQGNYATAWFDHGKAPKDGRYEYTMLIKVSPADIEAYANKPRHRVVQQDNAAHVVAHDVMNATSYAVFASDTTFSDGPVRWAEVPCFVVAKQTPDGLTIAYSDPDLRRPKMNNMALMPIKTVGTPSLPAESKISLKGAWSLGQDSTDARITSTGIDEATNEPHTELEFTCVDGKTIQVTLSPRK